MTRINRWLLYVTLFVVVQTSIVDAATVNSDGSVTLTWSATYIPFSWKFSIDPFPYDNGSLSMSYDPTRAELFAINPMNDPDLPLPPDYEIVNEGENDTLNGVIRNIRFQRRSGATAAAGDDLAIVFTMVFKDRDAGFGAVPGPPFVIFAGPGDGFNCDFQGSGGCEITNVKPFGANAPYEPIPEPGSLALVSLGALGLLAFRRRRLAHISRLARPSSIVHEGSGTAAASSPAP